ncbi:MAG: RnfABCDGE type electron transport complex subunit D [Treponemataceae bacterium]|nr:RnfABCDGE type electron transport complex subunit D [Treponemataceae bacterium]
MILSSSPHISSGRKTQALMFTVLASLIPECVYGVVIFGIPALITILASVASSVLFEFLFNLLAKKKQTVSDGSAIITGILLALVLPPTIPVWQTVLGAAFGIIVAKSLFGGLGSNVWNPALTGRAFLFVSFPVAMGSAWITPLPDAVSTATILPAIKSGAFTPSREIYLQYFFGNRAGCIGETSILLILISFVFLLATRTIDWRAPFAMVATTVILTWISGGDILMALLSGGLIFGATFMVTDYVTAPVTKPGRLIYGAGCGLITFLIRKFGGYPEGVMFSILIMDSLAPFLNKITRRKYGYKKSAMEAK